MKNRNIDGILIVDKPRDVTSHDVVNIVRRMFKTRRVGHAGTLDPIATGVLVILIGKATKRSSLLANDEKEYSVGLRLGVATDTGDAFGKVMDTRDTQGLDRDTVERAMMSLLGEIEQVPPMFSAVKYKGESLYKLARRGITVPRKARKVFIKKIAIKKISIPEVFFYVLCSKGTYIRQLCVDVGRRLGCGGHMIQLRRIRSGDFHISEAVNLERLNGMTDDDEQLRNLLI